MNALVTIFAIFFASALAKLDDDKFLSKCTCASATAKPDCDFSKLSKKKLKKLVERLMVSKIGCVSADDYFAPMFTSSFSTSLTNELAMPKSGQYEISPKQDIPPVQSKVLSQDCKLDGLSCVSRVTGIEYLFPTTILTNNLIRDQQSQKFNEEIKNLMLELEEEDDGCKFNLHGGYRSKDGFINRPEPAIQWLKSQIVPRVQMMLSLSNSTHLSFTLEGWGAVLRSGHGQNNHVHPASMFAGVYYVAAPAEVAKSGKSAGCLQFVDPRMGAAMAQVVRGKNIYGETFEICPPAQGGLLVIFPSWLMHEVKPMPSDYKGPRIAISFNVLFNPTSV